MTHLLFNNALAVNITVRSKIEICVRPEIVLLLISFSFTLLSAVYGKNFNMQHIHVHILYFITAQNKLFSALILSRGNSIPSLYYYITEFAKKQRSNCARRNIVLVDIPTKINNQ